MARAKGSNGNLKSQLAEKANAPAKTGSTVYDLIKSMEPEIRRALPKQISPERFARIALTAVRTNPKLQQCNPYSFLAALMQSAQLGLEPNTPLGQAYIIPYGKEAQFQLGYQGLLTLAYRTGEYKSIYAQEVHENDHFKYEFGLNEKLEHRPAETPEGEPTHYYAVYHLKNGGHGFVVMSRDKIIQHMKKYSPSANSGTSPWKTDFDSMAKKTVLKQLLKYAPKSVEFAAVLNSDETVKTELSEDMTDVVPEEMTIDATEYNVAKDEEEEEAESQAEPEQPAEANEAADGDELFGEDELAQRNPFKEGGR